MGYEPQNIETAVSQAPEARIVQTKMIFNTKFYDLFHHILFLPLEALGSSPKFQHFLSAQYMVELAKYPE